jgi:hypothetical protein
MAVTQFSNMTYGEFLQVAYSAGIRSQISKSFKDWEMIKQVALSAAPDGKQLEFLLQTGYGPSAVQVRGVNQYAFPASQRVGTATGIATYKEIDATIEIEYNAWNRARKAPSKYAEPLALEIMSKTIASKRFLAASVYGDGTGVIGQLLDGSDVGTDVAAVTSPASDKLVFDISSADTARGHIGFFERDDILVLRAADGTASALDTNLGTEPVYWKVVDKNRSTGKVTLQGLNSSFASAGTISSFTTQPDAGEVFYRIGQQTGAVNALDLTAIGSSDYGTLTELWPGLESLTANDGRKVHNLTMSGALGGSRFDCGGSAIDTDFLHGAMDQVKINVGSDQYSWKKAVSAPEVIRKLIDARETDRRFNSIEDNKRGVRSFIYQHEQDALELVTGEFVPFKRMFLMPEGKAGNGKVLEFHGTDFEPVKGEDMSAFHLRPSADGGHERIMNSYLEALAVLICKHPASFAVLTNFTY